MAFFCTFALLFGCVLEETHGATVLENGSEKVVAKHKFFTVPPLFLGRLMETSLLVVPSRDRTWLFFHNYTTFWMRS